MNYVMSDLHGNSARFRSVMDKIHLSPDDRLYIGGDVIDRYPDGLALLRQIREMPNAQLILGNHEYMMLNALTPEGEALPWKRGPADAELYRWFCNGGQKTMRAYRTLSQAEQKELREYLTQLPLNLDLSVNGIAYKLVHAAPLELFRGRYGAQYEDAVEFAVWHRFDDFRYLPEEYVMIFGHTPTAYYRNESKVLSVWHGEGVIDIDCGSGFPPASDSANFYQGRLACLRLEDMAEFYSDL